MSLCLAFPLPPPSCFSLLPSDPLLLNPACFSFRQGSDLRSPPTHPPTHLPSVGRTSKPTWTLGGYIAFVRAPDESHCATPRESSIARSSPSFSLFDSLQIRSILISHFWRSLNDGGISSEDMQDRWSRDGSPKFVPIRLGKVKWINAVQTVRRVVRLVAHNRRT